MGMKADVLTQILTKQAGARKEGPGYLIPSDVEVTLFVALEGETLSVQRVIRLEITDTLAIAETSRGEHFVLAAEDIRALKLDRSDPVRRERGAGFGK